MYDAVEETVRLLTPKLSESLIIVTSDHANSLTINDHHQRGLSIFGVAQNSRFNGTPFGTLTYGTGHYGFQVEVGSDGTVKSYLTLI